MIRTIIYKIKKKPYQFFFVKLFVFIVIFFLLDFAIGNLLQHLYFKQRSGFLYRTTYAIENTKADVLIFGSSRAIHHYASEIIEKQTKMTCYNVGAGGQSIFYDYALLKCILERYTPKTIILDLRPGELVKTQEDYDKISELLPYYHSNKEIHSIIEYKSPSEKFKLLSKIYPYNSLIFKIIIANFEFNKERNETEKDIKGFVPLTRIWDEPIRTDSTSIDNEMDNNKLECYENFLKDCKKRGIQLFVFVSPYYIKTTHADYSLTFGQETANKYDIKFYDYSSDTLFTNNGSLFSDEGHLNGNGAILYTNIVANKLMNTK